MPDKKSGLSAFFNCYCGVLIVRDAEEITTFDSFVLRSMNRMEDGIYCTHVDITPQYKFLTAEPILSKELHWRAPISWHIFLYPS